MNRETHLLGIKMCSRPLSLSELLRVLRHAGRRQRSGPAADRGVQQAAAGRGGLRPRLSAARSRARALSIRPGPRPLPRHHRDLVFDHVSFRYSADQPVLDDIDLRIPFGETIAIVGPNGCGKSTLANLIPRFFDPVSGSVRIDGIRPARRAAARPAQPDRPGHAGDAAVRRHGAQQHSLRLPARHARASDRGRQAGPRPQVHRAKARSTATKRWSARGAAGSRADSGSGSRWPGPSCATRRS